MIFPEDIQKEFTKILRFFDNRKPKYIFLVVDSIFLSEKFISFIKSATQSSGKIIEKLDLVENQQSIYTQTEHFLKHFPADGLLITGVDDLIYSNPDKILPSLNLSRDAFEKFGIPIAFFVNRENRIQIIQRASDFYQMRDLPDFEFKTPPEGNLDLLDLMWPFSCLSSDPKSMEQVIESQLARIEQEQRLTDSTLNHTVLPLLSIYIDQKNIVKAQHLFFKHVKGNEEKLKTPFILGDYYLATRQPEKALLIYEKDLKHQEAILNRNGIMKLYEKIGKVYAVLNQFPKAIDYFNKVLDFSETLRDNNTQRNATHSLAIIYDITGNSAKARAILKELKK